MTDAAREPVLRRTSQWAATVTAGRSLAALAAAAWVAVLARVLEIDAFGDLALLVGLSTVFAGVTDGGVSVEVARQLGAAPEAARSVFRSAVQVRLRLGSAGLVMFVVAYAAVGSTQSPWAVGLMVVSTAATMVHQLAVTTCRAAGRRRVEPFADAVPRVALLTVGVAVATSAGLGLTGAAALYAATDVLLAVVVSTYVVRRLPGDAPVPEPGGFRMRALSRNGIGFAFWMLQQRGVVWFVALWSGPTSVAYFAAAQRLSDAAVLPSSALGSVAVPQFMRSGVTARRQVARTLVGLALAVSVPAVIVAAVASEQVTVLAFGSGLRGAAPTVRLLLLGTPLVGCSAVLLQLAAALRPDVQLRATLSSVIVLVASSVLMIPRWGASGAAGAFLISQAVQTAILASVLRHRVLHGAVRAPVRASAPTGATGDQPRVAAAS